MGKGYIDKARQGSDGNLQILSSCRALTTAWAARFSVWSARGTRCTTPLRFPAFGRYSQWALVLHLHSYKSTAGSVTCLRALRAIVWKACSTLMASLALVSKYGMLFLLWHQACARLVVTWSTKMTAKNVNDQHEKTINGKEGDKRVQPVCSPSQSCCPAPQKGSSLGLVD